MAMDKTKTTSSIKKKPCGTGRRKVEIKRIESSSSRMVAFSKRKKGIFKKACELYSLCDANIAVVIFSSTGRPFTFGKPSADHVIDQFLHDEETNDEGYNMEESSETLQLGEDDDDDEEEEEGFWWEESIEGLGLEELDKYKASLEALRYNVAMKLEETIMRRDHERDFLSFI